MLVQRILCLFTAADRAESIVGDLLEESRAHASGWFSLQSVGTAFALCFRSVRAAPGRALWVAASALALFVVIYAALAAVTGLFRYFDPSAPESLDASLSLAPFGFWIRVLIVVVGANFLTGLLITRFASTRTLTGSTPLVVFWLVCWLAWPLLAEFLYGLSWYWIIGGALVFPFFYLLPLLAGSALALRRSA
jgi:hypothetical protein